MFAIRPDVCNSGEAPMKKDTQIQANVRKANAQTSPMKQQPEQPQRFGAPGTTPPVVTISARYIDSRLKQFCSR